MELHTLHSSGTLLHEQEKQEGIRRDVSRTET